MLQTPCRICEKSYDGTKHCGVNACRNCAMFFKRTPNLSEMPKCRSVTGDCDLKDIGNVKCTLCRYKKCVAVGMTLQTTRRGIKPGTNPSTSSDSYATVLVNEMALIIPEKMPSLKRFCYYYADFVNKQRKCELDIMRKSGVSLKMTGNRLTTRISLARCNELYVTNNLFGFYDLLRPGYAAFATIDSAEQFVIFKKLLFPIFNFSALFRSLRTFSQDTRKILVSESMYLDLDDMTGFLDHKTFDPMDARLIHEHFVLYWGRHLDSTLRFMRQMKITDVEFLVVFSLTLWEERNFNESELFRIMAEKQRSLILKDLHYYYNGEINSGIVHYDKSNIKVKFQTPTSRGSRHILNLENYVERVLNIMQLCRIIQENQKFEAESFHFLKTFNYYGETQLKFMGDVMETSE